MGRSGGRKKKAGVGGAVDQSGGVVGTKVDLDASVFLKRAHELKEEGNKRFQSRDYVGALEQYEQALKLTPRTHPDRAVFHSNRAACLMQMKPIQYESVVNECTRALEVHPRFSRALFRRARAYEGMGKLDLAMQDVQTLLQADSNHQDALELVKRLRVALGNKQEAQQDLQNRPTMPAYSGTSPAAVGASAVRGTPMGGMGPCLPARPVPKKKNKTDKLPGEDLLCSQSNGPSLQEIPLPRSSKGSSSPRTISSMETSKASPKLVSKDPEAKIVPLSMKKPQVKIQWRSLKLIFDHDIRLAQMPANCKFKELREIVRKRFSSSKAVLIKYRDLEGDLVTITSTDELRFAEAAAAQQAEQKRTGKLNSADSTSMQLSGTEGISNQTSICEPLRLYIVEVNSEQEPLVEEEEPLIDSVEDEVIKSEENASGSSGETNDSIVDDVYKEPVKQESLEEAPKEKNGDDSQLEGKEVEIDDWLFEFAQLFRTHVGIDPDAHVDLHELGMEMCSEALEETVTSEEAQHLFEMAACKFQEVAALAFFNWGNVHMCAARKRIPLDENSSKEVIMDQLQAAYDWVQDQYSQAGQKYEEALRIKPDFYEGLLALGQQHFESAKLRWSLALASKIDLGGWDSSETIQFFNSAEEKMQAATEMWEKLEEQRQNELKDPSANKKEEILKRKRKLAGVDVRANGDSSEEIAASAAEAAEQATVMRSQIHLFWGNMLFERSQVEVKLGLPVWKEHLDAAVERFKLAGASSTDIDVVLKNHLSNATSQEGKDVKTENQSADATTEKAEDKVRNENKNESV
eukprot:Gb_20152 [translate_table: standard]